MKSRVFVLAGIVILTYTFVVGFFSTLKHREASFHRNVYLGMLVAWFLLIGWTLQSTLNFYKQGELISGFLGNGVLTKGVVGLLSFLYYGISSFLSPRNCRRMMVQLSVPMVILLALDLWIIYSAGLPYRVIYPTFDALMANIASPAVIICLVILVIQIVYVICIIYSTATLIPIYNRYIEQTQSNEQYSLKWLYAYLTTFGLISTAYFIFSIYATTLTTTVYCFVTTICFVVLTEYGRFYKVLPEIQKLDLRWNIFKGWQQVESDRSKAYRHSKARVPAAELEPVIREWIVESKAYANVNFSVNDLLEQFPQLNHYSFSALLELQNITFQSYIRNIRVNAAIEIIAQSGDDIRYKELYGQVGFTHYSSFSRAFTSVTGKSPSEYKSIYH